MRSRNSAHLLQTYSSKNCSHFLIVVKLLNEIPCHVTTIQMISTYILTKQINCQLME